MPRDITVNADKSIAVFEDVSYERPADYVFQFTSEGLEATEAKVY